MLESGGDELEQVKLQLLRANETAKEERERTREARRVQVRIHDTYDIYMRKVWLHEHIHREIFQL